MTARELRIFLAVDEHVDYEAIRHALPAGAPVRETTLADAATRLPILLADGPVDVIILGCGEDSERALRVIETASAQRPEAPIVVLYAGSPNGFMEAAFEAGAADLITLPQGPTELTFTLEKVMARRRGATAASDAAPMITVLGPKGGTGKTLTACNLAVALAADGMRSVIVDLDLQFGDVGLALGLRPDKTIYELATSVGSLDADKADGYLAVHESGARALLAPIRPDQASAVKIPFLQALFDVLRTRYDFVIVDTPPAFSPEVIAAIDASSHLCMVGMLDALSLKDTKIGLETLHQMGHHPAEATLVLNRADTSVGISEQDVERILGRAPDVFVPSDVAIPRAITHGLPIFAAAPRSGAAHAYTKLARIYSGNHSRTATAAASAETPAPPRRGLLRRR